VTVLDEIERWARDSKAPPVFWLNGLAGTGKSAIAQTTAERMFAHGLLGASFFCSRGVEDRSNLKLIFPTVAFQLAQKYSSFRSQLIPLLQSNPDIVHESLRDQMQKFLVNPLRSAHISTIIVIDALYECRDEDPESAILLVLGQLVSKIPGAKFFITSRPETHIMTGFRGPMLKNTTNIFILHDVEPRTIDNDIRCFFKHELLKLARRPQDWPTDAHLDLLCRRAAGFFVYAVATVNFLKHKFRRPSDQLDIIAKSPGSTSHEGQMGLKVYHSLDSLYTSIFHTAFLENNADDDDMVRSVLSIMVLATNPLSPSIIATLTGLECDVVMSLLELIRSLLVLHNIDHPIQPFHKSFSDFITDPARCVNKRFHVSPGYHLKLALNCLQLMDKSLKRNMCSLPDYALNSDVDDLLEKIEESGICGALEYACRSWYKHLVGTTDWTMDVVSALRCFLEEKFVFWLEVLSVVGAVGDAAHALTTTIEWLNEVCIDGLVSRTTKLTQCQIKVSIDASSLLDTTADCLCFVTEFFEVISQSASHIYHSALQLAPQSSIVQKLYSHQIGSQIARIVTGIPTSWDSCTASVGVQTEGCGAVWSPCGKFIAVNSVDGAEIWDSNTLERLSALKFDGIGFTESFAFSPNGCLLACAYFR
jgi:hypothetical protein